MNFQDIRPIELHEIEAARRRIADAIVRTPVVRLDVGARPLDVRLKLENLQPSHAYKLRGAANAVGLLTEQQRADGVWTISSGNAGLAIANAARQAGIKCTVVMLENAARAKFERIEALQARTIPVTMAVGWKALEDRSFSGVTGTFIHPFDDHNFLAGHATLVPEILEDVPDATAIVAPIGGGGLVTAIGNGVRALNKSIRVWGAEPETAAPAAKSFAEGRPQKFEGFQESFVEGAGAPSVLPRMWQRMKPVVDGSIVVTLDETRKAMRLLAERARVVCEGAGALPVAAALTGKAGNGPVVAVISGGNIDISKYCEIISAQA
jgi:threonine dehydratase